MEKKAHYASSFKEQLTLRGILIGILGSIIITTSSMYVALKMGALPWPTIFVAVMSMSILKLLGNTNLNEINVTHTTMSAGAMVAGGLAFTIPGIWILFPEADVDIVKLLIVTLSGTILGTIFTSLVREFFIEKEELPFPMGVAASETVLAGDEGGKKAKILFGTMGITAVFVAIRDWFGKIPSAWVPKMPFENVQFGVWIAPMAVAIGYIIGPLFTSVWFIGAILAYFIIIPFGLSSGFFGDMGMAIAFKDSLGIGLMVGTGIGILLKGILPKAKEIYGPMLSKKTSGNMIQIKWIALAFVIIIFALTYFVKISLLTSIMLIVGVWITTAMAASITGQTGINPMEIFGIIVLLFIRIFSSIGGIEAFLVAGVVAIACGLTGDVLNDFKSGKILRSNPKALLISETIGGVVGAIVSVFVLSFLFKAYGAFGPGTELLAPQAYAVSTMVGGLPNTPAFIIGLVIGAVLYIFNIPGMTLGLGVYLPITITTTAFIGGMLRFIQHKFKPNLDEYGTVVSSGLLGGEAITGVIIAIITVLMASN